MYQDNLFNELIIDNFAGGGGASVGIELATGRPVDIAINHDADALLVELQEEIDFKTSMYTEEQNQYFSAGLKCAYRDVIAQPTADVVEIARVNAFIQRLQNITGAIYHSDLNAVCKNSVLNTAVQKWTAKGAKNEHKNGKMPYLQR